MKMQHSRKYCYIDWGWPSSHETTDFGGRGGHPVSGDHRISPPEDLQAYEVPSKVNRASIDTPSGHGARLGPRLPSSTGTPNAMIHGHLRYLPTHNAADLARLKAHFDRVAGLEQLFKL